RVFHVTGVQTCALPISATTGQASWRREPSAGGEVVGVRSPAAIAWSNVARAPEVEPTKLRPRTCGQAKEPGHGRGTVTVTGCMCYTPPVTRRTATQIAAVVLAIPLAWYVWAWISYPSDRTVEGAYLRVMTAVNRGEPAEFFAYIETPAQHACYTIKHYRKKARARVLEAY